MIAIYRDLFVIIAPEKKQRHMKIGIIKENKVPNDNRVPLSPEQCKFINDSTDHTIIVESSDTRCFEDKEYKEVGITVASSVEHCDLLMGVKEVPLKHLVANKSYMFFSHTIKKQAYNRSLLQAILSKRIRLIDYETLKNKDQQRVIAFGKFAGMVGAHNGVMAYGSRTGLFSLERMTSFLNYKEAVAYYLSVDLPPMKIVLTGTGRVGNGAAAVLRDMNIKEVTPSEFLSNQHPSEAVFTQLSSADYIRHKDSDNFDKSNFYSHPENYRADFSSYWKVADIFINGIYWDSSAPKFFSLDDMRNEQFSIQVIADITCDIAPDASVPSTVRASTIEEPIYGFNPISEIEEDPFQPDCIDVMAIDNLPNELSRDASRAFGDMFIEHVLHELDDPNSEMIINASITNLEGELTSVYSYLEDFVSQPCKNE